MGSSVPIAASTLSVMLTLTAPVRATATRGTTLGTPSARRSRALDRKAGDAHDGARCLARVRQRQTDNGQYEGHNEILHQLPLFLQTINICTNPKFGDACERCHHVTYFCIGTSGSPSLF